MFSRSTFRAAQPLKQYVRRYATEPARSSAISSYAVLTTGVAVAGGGAYYFLGGRPAAKKAEDKVKAAAAAMGATGATDVGAKAGIKAALTGGDQGWISLLLEDVETVNHNTKKFRFKLPEEDMVSGLHITSAILTKFQAPGMDKPVVRPYTPISEEGERGYLELLIKKYPNGPMSTHLHDMQPGQRLDIKGPLSKYPWTANKHDHVALVAGGTGITPMYQLCRRIMADPNDRTQVTLVFGNVSEEDILLRSELGRLENTHPRRFRAFYVLDRPADSWPGGRGHITKELLKTVLPEPKEGSDFKVFVCGPPGMMKAISGPKVTPTNQGELEGLLKELGYNKDQVYKF